MAYRLTMFPAVRPSSGEFPMPLYRLPSEFGPGLRDPLGPDQRSLLRAQFWRLHLDKRLTRATRDIGHALLRFMSEEGRCDPGYATIAQRAGCSVATVGRGLIQLRDCGIVRWVRRLVREGDTVRQATNSYALAPIKLADTQNERAIPFIGSKKGLKAKKAASSERDMDRAAFEAAAQQLEALGRYADAANVRARAPS